MRAADAVSWDRRGGAGQEGRRAAGVGRQALRAVRRREWAGATGSRHGRSQRGRGGAAALAAPWLRSGRER